MNIHNCNLIYVCLMVTVIRDVIYEGLSMDLFLCIYYMNRYLNNENQ